MIKWRIVDHKTRYWDVKEEGIIDQKGHSESLVCFMNRVGYWEFTNNLGIMGIPKKQKVFFIR